MFSQTQPSSFPSRSRVNYHTIFTRPSSTNLSRPAETYPLPEELSDRVEFLQSMVGSLREFQRSKNIVILQQLNQKNAHTICLLVDQVFDLRQSSQRSGSVANQGRQQELEDLKKENDRLQKECQEQKRKEDRLKQKKSGIVDRQAAEVQLSNLKETASRLTDEVQKLDKTNKILAQALTRKKFFKQYQLVMQESEGIQKQNDKLNEYIRKWKGELEQLSRPSFQRAASDGSQINRPPEPQSYKNFIIGNSNRK